MPAVDALVNACRAAAVAGSRCRCSPRGGRGAGGAAIPGAGGVLGMLADQKLNDGIAVPLLGWPR